MVKTYFSALSSVTAKRTMSTPLSDSRRKSEEEADALLAAAVLCLRKNVSSPSALEGEESRKKREEEVFALLASAQAVLSTVQLRAAPSPLDSLVHVADGGPVASGGGASGQPRTVSPPPVADCPRQNAEPTEDSTAEWNCWFDKLKEYQKEHGHTNVPYVPTSAGPSLGGWVQAQRRAYERLQEGPSGQSGTGMSSCRISALEAIGFQWNHKRRGTGAQARKWLQRFTELKRFHMEHGHCDVPRSSDVGLARWVINQRTYYRYYQEGKPSHGMSSHRIAALEQLGFRWSPWKLGTGPQGKKWEARLEELKRYRTLHGDCDVPRDYDTGLGRWVVKQRFYCRQYLEGKPCRGMSAERVKALAATGFWLELRSGQRTWRRRLDELRTYKEQHGDCNVPQSHGGLGSWVHRQRRDYKLAYVMPEDSPRKEVTMPEHRIVALEELGFQWDVGVPNRISPSPATSR